MPAIEIILLVVVRHEKVCKMSTRQDSGISNGQTYFSAKYAFGFGTCISF
jgi:hypothetical protein